MKKKSNSKLPFALNAIMIGLTASLLGSGAQAAITEFSLSGMTGTFQTGSRSLSMLGNLAGTGNTYNYNSQFFTPSVSGSYTFGTSFASFDTVLIFYSGSYNPANPTANAIAINDDSHGGQNGRGLAHAGTCIQVSLCSQITANLTAGTNYYLVTTTYSAGTPVNGVIWYYVDGVGIVGVAGTPTAPEVPVARNSVLASNTAMSNNPAFAVAKVIDANQNLLTLFTPLRGDDTVSKATSQTLPLLSGGSIIATQSALSSINRVIQARIEGNRGMSSGNDFAGDKNLWMKPFGSWANQSERNGIAGYKANTYGVALGYDAPVSDSLRLGAAFAYAKSSINGQSSVASQNADVDVYQLIGYGSYSLTETTEVDFQADIGQNKNKGQRTLAFISSVANASYDSQTAHAGVGIGRTFPLTSKTSFTPSLRLDYTWIRDKGYSETGAGLFNLNVDGRSTEALVIGLGGKLSHQFTEQLSFIGNAGVGYDTINKRASITAAFAGAPGAAFVTDGMDPKPWITTAGLGLVYKTKAGLEVTGRYDAEHREGFLNQTASMKLRWSF